VFGKGTDRSWEFGNGCATILLALSRLINDRITKNEPKINNSSYFSTPSNRKIRYISDWSLNTGRF
jgi:hypothetical protein